MRATPITIRRTVAATGVCLTGLMLTACQSGAVVSAAGATQTPTATASPDACQSNQLQAGTAYNSAYNSGSTLISFVLLTNTSTTTCTLSGYAGMDFLDPSGHSLSMSTQRVAGSNAMPLDTQTLAPGRAAAEEFTFTFAANDQGNGCVNAGTIAVIPPNQTQPLDTKLTSVNTGTIPFFGVCGNAITVFPFEPSDKIHV